MDVSEGESASVAACKAAQQLLATGLDASTEDATYNAHRSKRALNSLLPINSLPPKIRCEILLIRETQ